MQMGFKNGGNKYIVIKEDDIFKYLEPETRTEMALILSIMTEKRAKEKKMRNHYLVINLDEWWASHIVEIIEDKVGKQDCVEKALRIAYEIDEFKRQST